MIVFSYRHNSPCVLIILLGTICFSLAACARPAPVVITIVPLTVEPMVVTVEIPFEVTREATRQIIVTQEVIREVTRQVIVTREVQVTRLVPVTVTPPPTFTNTPIPTATSTPLPIMGGNKNIVTVAKSGGGFTSIQTALNSISDNNASSRYLVRVGPGTYAETVTMKPYVDIEGAGESLTTITYKGSVQENTGTVVGANNAELRSLTVQNTGGSSYAIAIFNSSASPRLTRVTVTTSGGTTTVHGVYNNNSSSPMMTDMTASGTGGYWCNGVTNLHSAPTMMNVTATCSRGTDNYGVNNQYSSPTMTNVTASASTAEGNWSNGVFNFHASPTMANVIASASGGRIYNIGVNNSSSSPRMTSVTASASGGADNYGVYNNESSPTIQNSTITAGGTNGNRYGIYNIASKGVHTVTVNNSHITGSTNTIRNDPMFTTRVEASQLSGGAVTNGGTVTCIGVYDENRTSYATCPD